MNKLKFSRLNNTIILYIHGKENIIMDQLIVL
jgi:hypothetical protein